MFKLKDLDNPVEHRVKCKICGKDFKVKACHVTRRKICNSRKCRLADRRLAMKAYRETDKGREMVKLYNLRYKRPDIEKVCEVCGEVFKTARESRYICGKPECKKKGEYLRMKKYVARNREKVRARGVVSKRIQRGVSLDRGECLVCSSPDTEAHHHNYFKPDDVIFLCKAHHAEMHKWDSN